MEERGVWWEAYFAELFIDVKPFVYLSSTMETDIFPNDISIILIQFILPSYSRFARKVRKYGLLQYLVPV